ncbi:MAG: class I SAM-dependent methyltransferase [bacterium]
MAAPAYEFGHCVVCGHTDAEVIAERDDLRDEVEWLWAFHEKRLRVGTPTERLMDRVAFSERAPLRLVRCNECGLIYRNPTERTRELTEIYAREAPAPEALRALHAAQRPALRAQARRVRRTLGHGGSGLEIGSYVGAFLAAARDEHLQIEGLDINPEVNAFARSMGFTVHDGEIANFPTHRTFDVVAILNTFDQLADPRGAAHAARRLLKTGGVLVVRVPNGGFYAALRGQGGRRASATRFARAFLAQNNLLTFPYRWGFTPAALTRLLRETGFVVEQVRGDVLVPTADEWTRAWARIEQTLVKQLLAAGTHFKARWAPWIEVYARRA